MRLSQAVVVHKEIIVANVHGWLKKFRPEEKDCVLQPTHYRQILFENVLAACIVRLTQLFPQPGHE